MTLDEYQKKASRTISNKMSCADMTYHSLFGMGSELGELYSIFQHLYQEGNTTDCEDLKKELGDLLWFVAEFATAHCWSLGEIAKKNIDKLMIRYPEGFSEERSKNRHSYGED